MALYAKKTLTAAASAVTAWIPLNQHVTPFNVSFGINKSGTGDATYRVKHTFDDVQDSTVTPVEFTHASVTAATNAAQIDGNYAYPVAAIKLETLVVSGASTFTFYVRQSGD